jgi:hypothetical protein
MDLISEPVSLIKDVISELKSKLKSRIQNQESAFDLLKGKKILERFCCNISTH